MIPLVTLQEIHYCINLDRYYDAPSANVACYVAKVMRRNRIHAYHIDVAELTVRHRDINWVGRINQALAEDRFCLYAQPVVPLDD
jgi:hypothetical protein